MYNLIKAEIFRLFNRKSLYVFWIAICVLTVIIVVLADSPPDILLSLVKPAFVIPVFLWPILTEVIIGEDYKDDTYINVVTYGVSKREFCLGKLLVAWLVVFITSVITMLVLYVSIMVVTGSMLTGGFFYNTILAMLAAVPLDMAWVSLQVLLVISIKRGSLASLVYLGSLLACYLVNIVQLMNRNKGNFLVDALPTTQLIHLIGEARALSIASPFLKLNTAGGSMVADGVMWKAAMVGLGYCIIFTVIGMLFHRRWEE